RESAAARVLREVGVDAKLVVQVRRHREIGIEEVRLEESDVDELAQAGDLGLQREALAVAEEVCLLDLRGENEVLDRREAGPDLERAGRAFADLDVDVDPVGRAAFFGRDVDPLEIPERGDEALGRLELA